MQCVSPAMSDRPIEFAGPHDSPAKERGQPPVSKLEMCLRDKPFQLVKPLVTTMRLFGLLHFNCKKSSWSKASKAYSIFVLLFFGIVTARLFAVYTDETLGMHSLFKISIHVWYLHCFVNAIATYKASRSDKFVEFLLKWFRLLKTNRGSSPDDPGLTYERYQSATKRRLTFFLVIAWAVFIANIVCGGYLIFGTNIMDFTFAPPKPSHSFATHVKVVVKIVSAYLSASWVFTLSLFIMMACVIYKEFDIFNDDLQKAVSSDGNIADLEWFRRRHQDICQMVETADDILSASNAWGILLSAIGGMLALYALVWSEEVKSDSVVMFTHFIWIASSTSYVLAISYGGGYLNHMAHAPLKTLHNIKVKQASPEFTLQMTMFLNKLTGESIGLTALDMFVIDKPTILTIIGGFITYFVVLIQFQQSASSATTPPCNCTDIMVG